MRSSLRVATRLALSFGALFAFSDLAAARTAPHHLMAPSAEGRVVLPGNVTPDAYDIDITPDAKALTFKGEVKIALTVHSATKTIVLNDADIVIDHAALSGRSAAPAVSYDDKVQTATFAFPTALKPGRYTLDLAYHGKIYEQASGFFALDYETPKGKARALFTQFENSDARRFVPSWDEPGRKARFTLTATVPADQMPISNMPVASTETLGGGLKRVHFAQTPKMSSYLLFFGLGDFERVHRMVDGVDVGVVVKRGDTAQAGFALDAAAHILPYYNSYFGTPFPLPKLDLIAGPGSSQFFGAMENWGAIFYFEDDLLIDPRVSTENDRQNVYITVAHEMAHQWFGDLVTMAWWDDLWLNEGFASWMENKVTDHFHPEWKVWLQELGSKQAAMQTDAKDGTHPIITPIKDVLQASGAFDGITYSKGAAVIRMLESYVGEDAFRAGVQRYMHDHAYGNTVTDDLWEEIDAVSPTKITAVAHDFTLQAGVPVVMERDAACAAGATRLGLGEGRYVIDPPFNAATWSVPVALAPLGGGATVKTVVTAGKPATVKVAGCNGVILNAGQTAYFRSRYSEKGFAAVAARYGSLSPDDQLGVLNDTASLAYVGQVPMADFLGLTARFPAGVDPVVGKALSDRLNSLDRLYDGLPARAAYRAYVHSVLEPMFARVGWTKKTGESDNDALLRASLIQTLGDLGDPAVIAEAKRLFAGYVRDPSSLDAATRRSVLRVVAVQADPEIWGQLHTLAKTAKTQLDRQELYNLLGDAEDKALAQQALDLALSGEPPTTTAPGMIRQVGARHPALAFDFAEAHWSQIGGLLEPSTRSGYMPRIINSASDPALIGRLDAFAAKKVDPTAMRDIRKTDATIRYNAMLRTKRVPEIDRWIATRR